VAAVEDGEYSTSFDAFVGEQLLTSSTVAAQTQAIDAFGVAFDEFKDRSDEQLVENIGALLPLSPDASDALFELLHVPSGGTLSNALFASLADDAVSRHLEPLLTEENAEAFAEEVSRRLPLAKEVQKAGQTS
jgi:hypothetical protein